LIHSDTLDLDAMRAESGYWYLATPYSKYPAGVEGAFREACQAAAWLVQERIGVYCPIAHTHPIAIHGQIDPLDHAIWLPADAPLMEGAAGLIVCMMPGWEISYGIAQERAAFRLMDKPIHFMRWPHGVAHRDVTIRPDDTEHTDG